MTKLILEDGTPPRRHRKHLWELLEATIGPLRIASAYVTDQSFVKTAIDSGRQASLLTSLSPMDIASGATKIETLFWMLKSGVKCRVLPEQPRLHAKVYLFGDSQAVITSANLTLNALNNNIEVGTEINSEKIQELCKWYDRLWAQSSPLSVERLSELKDQAETLRSEYEKFKKRAKSLIPPLAKDESSEKFAGSLQRLLADTPRFFVCNTFRGYTGHDKRTPTGGYAVEEEMHTRNFAAAWEDFISMKDMEQVEPGDAILMFASGNVGIVGVGIARSKCEQLARKNADRVWPSVNDIDIEWRVPVDWLHWSDDASALPYPYKYRNFTFHLLDDAQADDFRAKLIEHFVDET